MSRAAGRCGAVEVLCAGRVPNGLEFAAVLGNSFRIWFPGDAYRFAIPDAGFPSGGQAGDETDAGLISGLTDKRI